MSLVEQELEHLFKILVLNFLSKGILPFFLFGYVSLPAQYLIEGQIKAFEKPHAVFLSSLENWNDFNSIGREMILKETLLDSKGYFRFSGNELSEKRGFYRIHFVAEGLPKVSLSGSTVQKNFVNFIHSNRDSIRFDFARMNYAPSELKVHSSAQQSSDYFDLRKKLDHLLYTNSPEEYPNYAALIREKKSALMQEQIHKSDQALINMYALYHMREELEGDDPTYEKVLKELKGAEVFPSYASSLEDFRGATIYKKLASENKILKILLVITTLFLLIALWFLWRSYSRKRSSPLSPTREQLTSKESQVLDLILAHKTNKEIANNLFISSSTVKTHINNIYRKLQLKNRKDILEHFSSRQKNQSL